MQIKDLSAYKEEQLLSLLARVPFYKDLQTQGDDRLEAILNHSCIVELDAGETIMRKGDSGSWLYFLIKGRLSVYLDDVGIGEVLNTITPGELFGDLALLCNHERKATVAAEGGEKPALLFATDFKPFGDLENFTVVDLPAKLTFYRTMVYSIRWRLEVSRMKNPAHLLATELRRVPVYSGGKGELAELHSLADQAHYLASILNRWNTEGADLGDVIVAKAERLNVEPDELNKDI